MEGGRDPQKQSSINSVCAYVCVCVCVCVCGPYSLIVATLTVDLRLRGRDLTCGVTSGCSLYLRRLCMCVFLANAVVFTCLIVFIC